MFPYVIWKIFKNTYCYENLWTTASKRRLKIFSIGHQNYSQMTMPVTIISYWKKNRKFYYGDKETKYTCTRDFKTLNNLNPNFTKEIFYISPHNPHTSHDIFVQCRKTTKYGVSGVCVHIYGTHATKNLIYNINIYIQRFYQNLVSDLIRY